MLLHISWNTTTTFLSVKSDSWTGVLFLFFVSFFGEIKKIFYFYKKRFDSPRSEQSLWTKTHVVWIVLAGTSSHSRPQNFQWMPYHVVLKEIARLTCMYYMCLSCVWETGVSDTHYTCLRVRQTCRGFEGSCMSEFSYASSEVCTRFLNWKVSCRSWSVNRKVGRKGCK